jgi:hypothetical protein
MRSKPGAHALALLCGLLLLAGGCSTDRLLGPDGVDVAAAEASFRATPSQSCWGQASAGFARMGEMGEHSSGFDSPRLGLRNLARALYAMGVIEDDTMQALGAFVAAELGLEIAACLG